MVIHCYFEPYYAYLTLCAGVPIRIGDSQKIGLRPTINFPSPMNVMNLLNHEVDLNISLLKYNYSDLKTSQKLTLYTSESDDKTMRDRLDSLGCASSYIIIHPSTGRGNREWGEQRYLLLLRKIIKELDTTVVFTGSTQDIEKNDRIINLAGSTENCLNLAGKTSVKQLKSLIKNAELVIGTDTGPTHMAAAFSRPVVSISPTKYVKPLRWGPFQSPHAIVGNPQNCSLVCNPHQCQLPDCLDFISINDVFSKIMLLRENPTLLSIDEQCLKWLHHSLRVAIVIPAYNLDHKRIERYLSQLNEEGITYTLFVPNNTIKTELIHSDIKQLVDKDSIFIVSDFMKWVTTIQAMDINVIDSSLSKKRVLFLKFVSLLSAPKLSVPPIYISYNNLLEPGQTLLKKYKDQIEQFWSKDS